MDKKLTNTRYLALLGVFVAIELILGLVPNIGYIPFFFGIAITIVHVPVIIGGVTLGPKAGGILGFFFGLTSMIVATFRPTNPIEGAMFSPFFTAGPFRGGLSSVIICFVPRILVGIFAGLVFYAIKKVMAADFIPLIIAGIVGSMTNTVLVLGGIYLLFGKTYAAAAGIAYDTLLKILMGVVATNGLMEAAGAAVITLIVGKALLKITDRDRI